MILEMPSCGGCRTCEMACSFHHTGEFNPDRSSLKILEKSGKVGYELLLLEENGPQGFACDGCPAEEVPLCVQYCREYDDLFNLLLGISNRLGKPQEKQL